MDLLTLKMFLCRKDVKIFIIFTATGKILQELSRRYIEKNPEFFNDSPEPTSTEQPPRGGGVDKVIAGKVIVKAILKFLAEHGLTAGAVSASGVVLSKIPLTAISTYINHALPQNLAHLEKKKYSIIVDGKEILLDQCDPDLIYLFKVLEDDKIPFKEKQKIANSVLREYLNLNTVAGRRNFVICIVCVLSLLAVSNMSAYYIMMQNLIKALKSGKISKAMARVIIRRLRKKGIIIDPGLISAASE